MTEFWENAFTEKQMMWGLEPTRAAIAAGERFARLGVKDVLVPGVGYGRNAKAFLERGMAVTGIEISETAIALARSRLGLDIPIFHGSVTDMPFDERKYDGVFCYGLLYLLDEPARAKLLRDCARQLVPGGTMIFTVIAKSAPMYGKGTKLKEDFYETVHGVKMFFYDAGTVRRDFETYGRVEITEIDEPSPGGATLPFLDVVCTTR